MNPTPKSPATNSVDPSASQDQGGELDIRSLEALNRGLRELIQEVRVSQAPAEAADEARAAIERAREILAPHAYSGPFAQASLEGASPNELAFDDIADFFPYSPIVGPRNPISPPIRFKVVDGVVSGRVTWGATYCGPPNHVHGGVVACAFDELLGAVNVVNKVGAMTGTLTIRYRRPTPLFEEIRMEGRHTGTERRKVFAEGKMWHGDTLIAEAEGIFIRIEGDFRAMLTSRTRGSGEPDGDSGSTR